MKNPLSFTADQAGQLENRISELRQYLRSRPTQDIAIATNSIFNEDLQRFEFHYWHQPTLLTYPDFECINPHLQEPLSIFHQALIIYYFYTADGYPLTDKWISFSELPDGRFYNQAYQGYTGKLLAHHFQDNLDKLIRAVQLTHGEEVTFADRAFRYQVLPCLPLLLVYWQGDEDFPPNYQILFDASVIHYIPTDACAIAGKLLTSKLIACAQ